MYVLEVIASMPSLIKLHCIQHEKRIKDVIWSGISCGLSLYSMDFKGQKCLSLGFLLCYWNPDKIQVHNLSLKLKRLHKPKAQWSFGDIFKICASLWLILYSGRLSRWTDKNDPSLLQQANPHPTWLSSLLQQGMWMGTASGSKEGRQQSAFPHLPSPLQTKNEHWSVGHEVNAIAMKQNFSFLSAFGITWSSIYFPKKAKLSKGWSERRGYPELNYLMGLILKPRETWSGYLPDQRKTV